MSAGTVVVLNRNYEYWTEVSLKKVLKWLVQEKIEIIVTHETEEIGSVTFKIKMPLVVRLLKFVGFKPKSTTIPFSQEAVFNRDNNVCQFYHRDENGRKFRYKCNAEDRTIDHVVPLSQGGANSFLNTVCACRHCNEVLKKNKTPREAGLELIRIPVVPRRDKNSFVIANFTYNPKKLAHKKYMEQILGRSL
jgi:5-methylcytosine-specific restriction endonuclease McrA